MPGPLAGLGIECVQVSAHDAEPATRDAGNDFAFDEQRRRSDVAEALGHVLDLNVPNFLACLRVHGHYVIVLCAHVDAAVANREAPRASQALHISLFRPGIRVGPQQLSGCCVRRVNIILHALEVDHAIGHKRPRLQAGPQYRVGRRNAGG